MSRVSRDLGDPSLRGFLFCGRLFPRHCRKLLWHPTNPLDASRFVVNSRGRYSLRTAKSFNRRGRRETPQRSQRITGRARPLRLAKNQTTFESVGLTPELDLSHGSATRALRL